MIDRSLNFGRDLIKKYLSFSAPYNTVVDIGAGKGDDLNSARRLSTNYTKFIAIDSLEENLHLCQARGFIVVKADIERDRLPLSDESTDVVIANQILEHIKEIFWVFHEVTRILRVGGSLIIGVPNLASFHNRLLLALGKQPTAIWIHSAHVRGFTKHGLMAFLDACFPQGYRLKKFGGSNFYPFPPIIARPLATIFPNSAWGIFFLLTKVKPYSTEFLHYPLANHLETNYWLGE